MKSPFSFLTNQQLVYGRGASAMIASWLQDGPGRPVLITSRTFAGSAAFAKITKDVQSGGRELIHHIVHGEPSPEVINTMVSELGKNEPCRIASVGGGSVMDAGKAVAAMLCQDEEGVEKYLEGIGSLQPKGVRRPLLAVSTTAGTGSEATKNAVVSQPGENGFKKSLRHNAFVPDTAIVDPELIESCPPEVAGPCGMDAFTQLLEAFISEKSNPMTDALAWSGLEAFSGSFIDLFLDDYRNRENWNRVCYASYLSGVTLANAGLGTVHGIAGPLGGLFHIPHGTACANILPGVLKITVYRLQAEEPDHPALLKMARLGRLAADREDAGINEAVDFVLYMIDEWLQILKVPRLKEFGIGERDLDRVVALSDNKNNPVSLSSKEMKRALTSRL